ncbi:MAG: glycosyltransferase [Candidatus Shapirobacteria bacterium]|jgi:glycosyltransferase involved in cell wall biosynthesis
MKNQSKNLEVSIIIPCYNEENNLNSGVLTQVADFLSTQSFSYEVLICNDQSTDNSLKLVRQFVSNHPHFRALDLPKGGKPGALYGGIKEAKYSILLFTDMDQSTPLKEITKLMPFFNQGYDIVIGSRGLNRQGYNLLRQAGSRVFSAVRNLLLGTNIVDTQCGFKTIKTSIARQIFPQLDTIKNLVNQKGWRVTAYDVEMLFIAQKLGYKIKEVAVEWRNEDLSTSKGNANGRYIKESKLMAKEVWRVLINKLKGAYDS